MRTDVTPRWSRGRSPWPLRRWLALVVAVLVLVSVAAIAAGAIVITRLTEARERLVDQLDPAVQQTLRLEAAVLDQRSGAGGYTITGQSLFYDTYAEGLRAQQEAQVRLRPLVAGLPEVERLVDEVGREVDVWRAEYAEPNIRKFETTGTPGSVSAGAERFAPVRLAVDQLKSRLDAARGAGRDALAVAADQVVTVGLAIAAILLLAFIGATAALRSAAVTPMSRLAGQVRRVAEGEFQHEIEVTGPREVIELAGDVDQMRRRIVSDLAAQRAANAELDARTTDLARSNAELEQFAYVASHDLQEPLRKVAGFCQLLERRYQGQLDERADQYIGFAVDGAKRMQVLINDLLAFSRVGRQPKQWDTVEAADLVAQAEANLATAIADAGATVEVGPLPTVHGERVLLTAVFQNLIGNAVKFHGDDPPKVRVEAVRTGDDWEFAVSDNGIGVEPDYAERVFVIFQRLHPKESYAGTGIGLAMCRKIIEYHGGRIWLDGAAGTGAGATFRFTLPAEKNEDAP
ncbi:sensor histidine kinase [Actinokineospora sp. HUAS TT18]|uniref:sensor histidine kinase n=1 Tax=Actinokineospora sp. HUAS TT18 TaxID=3447451 RepID=UPI003F521503